MENIDRDVILLRQNVVTSRPSGRTVIRPTRLDLKFLLNFIRIMPTGTID